MTRLLLAILPRGARAVESTRRLSRDSGYHHRPMTKASPQAKVRELYEKSADSYSKIMDAEIDLPLYTDVLSRLASRISKLPGSVIDTSCGPGHMLLKYHQSHDAERSLVGIDLSPRMAALASRKLGERAQILTGDMCDLSKVDSGSAAAALSFFAMHHLGPEDAHKALQEWHRILGPGGQLVVATWEGSGPVDYGDVSDVVALRYSEDEVRAWAQAAGFVVDRCSVQPVDEMPMQAVYLEGTKGPGVRALPEELP